MQLSFTVRSFLIGAAGIALISAVLQFTGFGVAEAPPAETKRGFALNTDASLIAYHYSRAASEGIQRGIRVHSVKNGEVTHQIEGVGDAYIHSPAFSLDGQDLIAVSACWSDKCPKGLSGSRLISIDLRSGKYRALTDDGLDTPFWDFGYVNDIPQTVSIQGKRSDPVITRDGHYYLISAASPREVTTARDFAPKRLGPGDNYILQDNGGAVGFRGQGSMAAFGREALLILAGPARGGRSEASSRDSNSFGYLVDQKSGAIVRSWTISELAQVGVASKPSIRSAAGDPTTALGYVAVGSDVIALSMTGVEVFYSGGDGPKLWDLAASGDGKTLFAAEKLSGTAVPTLNFFTMDAATKTRYDFTLNMSKSSIKTIIIQ